MHTVEVIEEDTAMRTLLAEWLAGAGYEVRSRAVIGSEPEACVHVAVIDLGGSVEDMEIIVQRASQILPRAALVGISTRLATPGTSSQARSLGLSRLVSKPCSRQEMLAAVDGAISDAT